MKRKPAAFMSYVRFVDEHDEGRLTLFRERLSAEVRVQTGEGFPIFQDRKDILWGQNWKERIEESLDEVTFLIPIITPGFFKSQPCRDELQQFLEREKKLKRNDLILPVYYVDCPLLNDEAKRATDELAQVIAARQYADWRELRFEPWTAPQVGNTLAQLAVQIRDTLERVQAPQKTVAPRPAPGTPRRPTHEPPPLLSQDAELLAEISEAPRRPSAKTEPPTRVVDPMHRGDHLTITEAIEAANPGDRILVRPGLYQEGLVMDKPLEIIGEGDSSEIVVQAMGESPLLFKTTMGRVANLTMRQMGGGDWVSVNIAQGCLEVEGCDITSQSSSCVAIHGGADPRLRRNRIHDGKVTGVIVYYNGQGTLEDNDIFGNALAGVAIWEGGNPTLRRNRIHDSKHAGIAVFKDGQGTLEDNDIFGNALAGVGIIAGGNPTLRRNRIHDGRQDGVMVYEEGRGTLEDNDIFGNALAGVEIKTSGNPTLCHNRIHDNKQNGVYVHETGQGTLEDNDVFGNALTGVGIQTGGNATLRCNRIHDNKQSGVYVHEGGQGTLEDNDIFGNAYSGVEIHTCGNPTLRCNRIHDNKQSGVLVYDNGHGALEDNDIFGNAYAGVTIEPGGSPTLRRNRIKKNSDVAIWVYEKGAGTIEDNDLRDNIKGAWRVSPDSEPNVKRARNLE
jgi:parallel beta-helix repeat protein